MRGRCNTRDIDTGTNSAYDKEADVDSEMKYMSNQGYGDDDDYEEIHNIPLKKVKVLD